MTTHRLPEVAFSLLTSLLLIVGFITPMAHASSDPDSQRGDQPVSTSASVSYYSRSSIQEPDPAGYWTEEKMRSAIPAESLIEEAASKAHQSSALQATEGLSKSSTMRDSSYPVYPTPSPDLQVRNAVVPATTGKVFFTYPGVD